MYVCVHSTVKTIQFILHTMYIRMYIWIYVTVSAKTVLNDTFGISRNTILKH